MIHEEICSYEVAKLAEEKGFPQWFNYTRFKFKWDYYNHKGEFNGDVGDILKLRIKHKPIPEDMQPIAAPTQSLLQRWLREEKHCNIEIAVCPAPISIWIFVWSVSYGADSHYSHRCNYDTYEQALEDALKYALENLV